MTDPTFSLPYPLMCSGGLFLLLVGIAIVAGALDPRRRIVFLGSGLAVASMVTVFTAPRFAVEFGRPSRFQVIALFGAVLLEAAMIPLALLALRRRGESARWLGAFFVVGLHFLPMAVAFGPAVLVLGLATMLNAGIGLWGSSGVNLPLFWFTDGLLKVATGVIMMRSVA